MAEKTIKVRILADTSVDGELLKCNAVATLGVDQAKRLIEQGIADSTPASVKYAESLVE